MDLGRFSNSFVARSLTELVTIVTGVLVALAVNSWWAYRLDRAEEAEMLQAISRDLVATHDLVLKHIEGQTKTLQDLQVLFGGSSGPSAQLDDAQFNEIAYDGLWEIDPVAVQMSAYKAATSSGRIHLIDDPAIRRALADYDRALLTAESITDDAFQHQQTKLDPYLISHFEMAQFAESAASHAKGVPAIAASSYSRDNRAPLDDEALKNLIVSKYFLIAIGETSSNDLLKVLENLSKLIETRLELLSR